MLRSRTSMMLFGWAILAASIELPAFSGDNQGSSFPPAVEECRHTLQALEKATHGSPDRATADRCVTACRQALKSPVPPADPAFPFRDMCVHAQERNERRPDWSRI